MNPGPPRQAAVGLDGALALHNLTVGYDRHPALHHVSLRIPHGSLVAVVGPNGSGKSTLIKTLMGLLRPMDGRIEGLPERVAYLPQHPGLDPSVPLTVMDLVAMGLWHRVGAWRGLGSVERAACAEALAAVGLAGFERRGLDTLSGGQMQRALFARLILQDAPLVLLDEPFSAVDGRTTTDLLALLHRWHHAGKTVIAVLHDLLQVRAHFPMTVLLARQLVACGPTDEALSAAHWQAAQHMREPFDDEAPPCDPTPGHGGHHA